MFIFYFDCGTSRTRGYLLQHGKIVDTSKADVGSKDVSIKKDKALLISAMRVIYDSILEKHNLSDCDICRIYASGMVTSPYGLTEIPHSVTPIDKEGLKEDICNYFEETAFKREIMLIPGLKTSSSKATYENIELLNNVRGEETEAFGICMHIPEEWKAWKYAVIIPGSHTHSLLFEGETISDIYSTFSGEFFHAVTTATILSGAVFTEEPCGESPDDMQPVQIGCGLLKKYGMSRAAYIIHAMKIFDVWDGTKRRECLSAVINGAVMESIARHMSNAWKDVKYIIIYGDKGILETYKEAVKQFMPDMSESVLTIDRNEHNCAVEGFMNIIE